MSQKVEIPANRDSAPASAADSKALPIASASRRRLAVQRPCPVVAVSVTSAVLLVGAVVWVMGSGPVWVLHHIDGVNGLTGKDKAAALDAIRGRVITIATGILGIVAVYYTAKNAHVARRAQQHSEDAARRSHDLAVRTVERTAELTEQAQVTERYTKAIEQLGSENLHIRIGGIYALERIARDSARDHPTVINVLAAFVRERSHSSDLHAPIPRKHSQTVPDTSGWLRGDGRLRGDLQTALTVIGRRDTDHEAEPVDLTAASIRGAALVRAKLASAGLGGADLAGANLARANLSGAYMSGADLAAAFIASADLTSTSLVEANLTSAELNLADLEESDLSGAKLAAADLTGANLTDVELTGADLTGAVLADTKLTGANLTNANLTGANLTGAYLINADLTGADLTDASLTGAYLTDANLAGANLTNADLTDAFEADISHTVGTPSASPPSSAHYQ